MMRQTARRTVAETPVLPPGRRPGRRSSPNLLLGTTSCFCCTATRTTSRHAGTRPTTGTHDRDLLAEQLFASGSAAPLRPGTRLRAFAANESGCRRLIATANDKIADLSTVKNDPGWSCADHRFVRNNIVAAADRQLSFAVLIDQASFLFPPVSRAHELRRAAMLVTL